MSFDFDTWAELAKAAPDVFELQRRSAVEDFISTRGNVRRLRGLQWRIDQERVRARTSLQSCIRLSSLMWDSFMDYRQALNDFVEGTPFDRAHSRPSATITQMHRIHQR